MALHISKNQVKGGLLFLFSIAILWAGIHFFKEEGVQMLQLQGVFEKTDRAWLFLGLILVFSYVGLHAWMYQLSFQALGAKPAFAAMMRLYLKRNFLSVFLPAGFISSQTFFSKQTARSAGVSEQDVWSASGIFSVAALLSMVVVVAPALGWLLGRQILPGGAAAAFGVFSLILLVLAAFLLNLARRGRIYQWLAVKYPVITGRLDGLNWQRFDGRYFIYAVLASCLVEIVGIFHVWLSVKAVGGTPSWEMAFAGYLAVLVVLMTAPLLRGIGAVEALLAWVLMHLGIDTLTAVAAALLFRFFEFWLVLMLSIPAFLFRPGNLFLRLAPSVLLFLLGGIGIVSGLTPSIPERAGVLGDYLPLEAIHASAALSVTVGFLLMGASFYLYRGLRSAWWFALIMSIIALLSHLVKGFDYEEASWALLTLSALVYQHREYHVKTDIGWLQRLWGPVLIMAGSSLLLGTLGFYLLQHPHFGADFGWKQSFLLALQSFILLEPASLQALTPFGSEFLGLIHLLGGLSLLVLAYALFRPLLPYVGDATLDREKAIHLVEQYGNSALDYFKTYPDKQFYFPRNGQSFVSYKSTARYALALENPVAPNEQLLRDSVLEFDGFCRRNGLRSIYFRIPEASAPLYRSMGKSLLPLGQEAILNLAHFSLEGKERKALRNALHKMERENYVFVVHEAPQNSRLLQQLRAVSDDWLRMLHRNELSFSQGVFDESQLRDQTILTVENADGKIMAFLNLIPGAHAEEGNFDLMRRTSDAPTGTMDFLYTHLFQHLKDKGFSQCNLGLVPMSGLDSPSTLSENLMKLAYERVPRFSAYKSLRFFKEKFNPVWETKYIAYDNQLDLMNLPIMLDQVVRNG